MNVHHKKGFSLVELLVAVAIFMVVVTISVSTLLVLIDANRKSQSLKIGINNTFFGMESMTRLIRTGYGYHCGGTGVVTQVRNCPNGDMEIYFTDDTGQMVHIFHEVVDGRGSIVQEVEDEGEFSLTSSDIDVDELTFHVTGTEPQSGSSPDDEQPTVTITLVGTVNPGEDSESVVNLQSTVTQRILDQ
jgi:hypothetical protein